MRGVLTSGVAFIEGCLRVQGGLYEGFHCIHFQSYIIIRFAI